MVKKGNPLKELAKKYKKISEPEFGHSVDIFLKKEFQAKWDTVISFYTHKNHIYCITDDGWDIDPLDHFTDEDMQRFIDYISDENNLNI